MTIGERFFEHRLTDLNQRGVKLLPEVAFVPSIIKTGEHVITIDEQGKGHVRDVTMLERIDSEKFKTKPHADEEGHLPKAWTDINVRRRLELAQNLGLKLCNPKPLR